MKVFARLSIGVELTDDEFLLLKAGDGSVIREKVNNGEFVIDENVASYVPMCQFDEISDYNYDEVNF
jgi:hypothetical protein